MPSVTNSFDFENQPSLFAWQGRESPGRSWKRCWTQIKDFRGSMLGCVICLLLGFFLGSRNMCSQRLCEDSLAPRTFEPNTTFTEVSSSESDRAWRRLVPMGRGFVFVGASEHAIVHQGEQTPVSDIRAVSAFHQIHCLNEIRIGYSATHEHRNFPLDDDRSVSKHQHSPEHMIHCFDYLRQSLMCAADATLEKLQVKGQSENPSVDGWGTEHRCHDFNDLYEWTERHRATNGGGIQ